MSSYKTFLEGKLDDLLKPMDKDEVPQGWVKNKDGEYDVDGDVDLSSKKLTKLPYKFGKVSGKFDCSQNMLTSLEGSPWKVGGEFNCMYNKLATLKGGPDEVGHDFVCSYNELTSMQYMPTKVGAAVWCNHNKVQFEKSLIQQISRVAYGIYTK